MGIHPLQQQKTFFTPIPKQVQLYDELRDLAVNANGEATDSVVDAEALGSAGMLTYNSLCCDLKMCSYKNANIVRSYFSRQASGNWHYVGLLKNDELEADTSTKSVPLVRPGFGEMKPSETKAIQATNLEFNKIKYTENQNGNNKKNMDTGRSVGSN